MPGDLLGIYLAHEQLLKTLNGDTPPPPENRTQRYKFYSRILADKEARTLRIASELDRAYQINTESRKKAAATAAAQTKSSYDKVSRHEEAAEKCTTDTSMPKAGKPRVQANAATIDRCYCRWETDHTTAPCKFKFKVCPVCKRTDHLRRDCKKNAAPRRPRRKDAIAWAERQGGGDTAAFPNGNQSPHGSGGWP